MAIDNSDIVSILKTLISGNPTKIDVIESAIKIGLDTVKETISAMAKEELVVYIDENDKELTWEDITINQEKYDKVKITRDGFLVVQIGLEEWREIHFGPVNLLARKISDFVEIVEKNERSDRSLKLLTALSLVATAIATMFLAYFAFWNA